MSMSVITPIDITDAMLASCNIPENDYTAYSSGADYAVGDYVISTVTHTVYRAFVANGPSSSVVDPDSEAADFADPLVTDPDPRTWQIIGATNRWRLFDKKPSVQASYAEEITISLELGEIADAIALINLNAEQVQIVVTDPIDGEVYNETFALVDTSNVIDGYTYYFSPLEYLSTVTTLAIPPYQNATIDITISAEGGVASCGQIALGRSITFGVTTPGQTGFEGYDFSTVDTDIFGNLETTQRASTRIGRYRIAVNSTRAQAFARTFNALRGGVPAVWLGSPDDRIGSTLYGYARGWRIDYEDTAANLSYLTIEVQGTV